MGEYKKYWIAVVAVLIIGFSILGYLGTDVYHQAPPVPTAYVSQDGQVLFTKDDILHGQSAWQSTGGQSVGTVLVMAHIKPRTGQLIGCTKKCP